MSLNLIKNCERQEKGVLLKLNPSQLLFRNFRYLSGASVLRNPYQWLLLQVEQPFYFILFRWHECVREASEAFRIPRTTIEDKINERSEAKTLNRGNKQIISPEIEDR